MTNHLSPTVTVTCYTIKKKYVVVLPTTLKKKRVVQQELLFALFKKHGRLTYVKELFEYKNQLLNIKD